MFFRFAVLPLVFALVAPALAAPPKSAPVLPESAPAPPEPSGPTTPAVHSKYAIVVDLTSGKILWERHSSVRRPMASTTKMMSATLLLEEGKLDDIVTAPNEVKNIEPSTLHLTPGEKISLRDLLYAMLLRSANDTPVAGAVYLSGSVPKFVAAMNAKAKEIGALNTHFVTPNGLYAPGHFSTAADLAQIARYAALTEPVFNTITKTQKYKVTRSMHVGDVWVKNTAMTFLQKFPGADGIKTGYVRQAGHCFVGSATRQNWRLIAVALDSNICRQDVESLLNYGFHNFVNVDAVARDAPVGAVAVSGASRPVPVKSSAAVRVVVSRWKPVPKFDVLVTPLPILPPAPILAGTRLGTFSVLVGGKVQATGDAVASEDVQVAPTVAMARTTKRVGISAAKLVVNALGLVMLAATGAGMWRLYGRTIAKSAGRGRNRVSADVRRVD